MSPFFDDVNEWHAQMGLSHTGKAIPHLMGLSEFNHRKHLMFEEFSEFLDAHARGDLVESADALADLIWVTCGAAALMGLPLNEVWEEVHRSNCEKRPWREGDLIKPRNNVSGEIVKPAGWRGPDVRGVLSRYQAKLWKLIT